MSILGDGHDRRLSVNSQPACGVKREVEVMASPWKFLVRLVSPRPLEKQDGGAIKDGKPDVLAMAEPPEIPVRENVKIADQPTRGKTQPLAQSEPVSAQPEPLAETGRDIQCEGGSDSAEGVENSDPALPDIGATRAYAAPNVKETVKAAPVKGRGRAKKVEAVAVVSQKPPVVPTVSDEISLDEEIKVLRDQLESKLRLQNAQLKKMLERFDRNLHLVGHKVPQSGVSKADIEMDWRHGMFAPSSDKSAMRWRRSQSASTIAGCN
jgi:hypothetical protein